MPNSSRLIAGVALAGFLGIAAWMLWPNEPWRAYQPQSGDIVFQSLPRVPLVNAIEGATRSPWSHCGIVAQQSGRWVVYEAYVNVQATPLNEWFARSREGRFAVYRLKPEHRQHIPPTLDAVRAMLGRPYDAKYELDDEKIYCSELVWKAYRDASGQLLGETVALGSLHWESYHGTIEHYEGGPPPLERQMITPRDLAKADQLQLVLRAN